MHIVSGDPVTISEVRTSMQGNCTSRGQLFDAAANAGYNTHIYTLYGRVQRYTHVATPRGMRQPCCIRPIFAPLKYRDTSPDSVALN